MIAVLGGTGRVGSLVADLLAAQDAPAFLMARGAARDCALPVRHGDLSDRRSIRDAVAGADRVFLLTPHTPDQHLLEANALDACIDCGVQHIVKISGGAATLGPNGITRTAITHWRSEQAIEASGIGFTFLRPSAFAQNLIEAVAPTIAALGIVPAPFGRAAIAMLDVRDLAACAASELLAPDPMGGAWTVTGPRAVTFDAMAAHLERRAVRVPPQMVARALRRAGAPAHEVEHAERMTRFLAAGGDAAVTDHVMRLTGRLPRPVEQLLDEQAAQFAPTGPLAHAITRLTARRHH